MKTIIDAEESKYRQLKKLGQELRIPVPEAFWKLEVFDKDGRLIQSHRQRSHSYVRNAYNELLLFMAKKNGNDAAYGAGSLNFKTTGGIIRKGAGAIWAGTISATTYYPENAQMGFRGDVASVVNGIVVGTDATAESFEDYKLLALIANGTGAGQLSYVLGEVPTQSYNAGTKTWTIDHVRYMNNNSGGIIGVNEVGLVAVESTPAGGWDYCLYSRDKLGATVNIPNTGQLKVTYTIELTYPA